MCVSGLKVLPNPQQLGALDAALAQGGAPKGMVGKLMGMFGKKSKAMGQGGLDAAGTAAGAMGAMGAMGGDMVGEAMSAQMELGIDGFTVSASANCHIPGRVELTGHTLARVVGI